MFGLFVSAFLHPNVHNDWTNLDVTFSDVLRQAWANI